MFSVFQVNWDSIRPDSELYVSDNVCNKQNAFTPSLTTQSLKSPALSVMHKNSYALVAEATR